MQFKLLAEADLLLKKAFKCHKVVDLVCVCHSLQPSRQDQGASKSKFKAAKQRSCEVSNRLSNGGSG